MCKPKCYIAGKIGDLHQDVFEAHFEVGKRLAESNGYDPVSPLDLPHQHGRTWAEYMLEDLAALSKCSAIILLPTWMESPGAKIEAAFANRMGLNVIPIHAQAIAHINEEKGGKNG